MKLSPREREIFGALVAAQDAQHSRAAPGLPGCRVQPLSAAELIARRRAMLDRSGA